MIRKKARGVTERVVGSGALLGLAGRKALTMEDAVWRSITSDIIILILGEYNCSSYL